MQATLSCIPASLVLLSCGMKTLTIRLPDLLASRLEQESLSRRLSKSDIVRERLAALPTQPGEHPLADILKKSWSARVPSGPPRFRSRHKQRLAEAIRAKKLHR